MIRLNVHRFETIRRFVLVGVLAIGLAASTLLPALAQTSGTWKKTGNMKDAREPGAILLHNGQVLVAGGDAATAYSAAPSCTILRMANGPPPAA